MCTSTARDGGNRRLTHVVRQVNQLGEVTCLRAHRQDATVGPSNGSRLPSPALKTTYLVVGYSTGVVSVYSCSSFRALWSTRVHDLDASVIELYVVGDVLLTQSRAGEVKRWHIDWEGRRFIDGRRLDRRKGGEQDDDLDRVYSFSRMCCLRKSRCVAYPSRGGRVTVQNYDTDETVELETTKYGMVTSLAGVEGASDVCGTRGPMRVCVGYESGRVEMYDVRLDDGQASLVCEIACVGTDPCVALGCWAAPDGVSVHVTRGFAGDGTNGYAGIGAETAGAKKNPPLVHIGVVSVETEGDEEEEEEEEEEEDTDGVAERTSHDHQEDRARRYIYRHTASVMEPNRGLTATLRGVDQIVYRADGKYVAAACWDGKVRIYRVSTGKLVDVIVPVNGSNQASTCFAFEQRLLLVGSRDGTVSIYTVSG